MEYYKLLQLEREPFSNSPDPDYFFQSGQHLACLQKLELALRLKRGLNVVMGDMGTGKTTLCRQLLRKFSDEPDFECHLILDPSFNTSHDFTKHIFELICGTREKSSLSIPEMKEAIKQSLLRKGVDQNKTIVLIIDEGQKITAACVEILRELLNFETNAFKLLQIVIFAQLEFEHILDTCANFADRINMLHHLQPMNFKDTRKMVLHRIKLSSTTARPRKLFSLPAMWAIYRVSKGYPRKIIHLCHQSVLALIIQNRTQANWALIRSCRKRISPANHPIRRLMTIGLLAALAVIVAVGYLPQILDKDPVDVSLHTIKIPPPNPSQPVSTGPTANANFRPPTTGFGESIPIVPSKPRKSPDPDSQDSTLETALSTHEISAAASSSQAVNQAIAAMPSPQAAELNAPDSNPPELLGNLVVKPGDTMVGLVRTVYGTNRNRFLKAVMEFNSHIKNPNNIHIGQVISFPALRSNPGMGNQPSWWVILDEATSLPAAVHRLDHLSTQVPMPLQLICNWSPQGTMRFQIALNGFFPSEDDALNALRRLDQEVTAGSDIITKWPAGTVLFSNPNAGGINTVKQVSEVPN